MERIDIMNTYLPDGTLNPEYLRQQSHIFPEKHLPDFYALAEENHVLDQELELDGYPAHFGPSGPQTSDWSMLIALDIQDNEAAADALTEEERADPDEDSFDKRHEHLVHSLLKNLSIPPDRSEILSFDSSDMCRCKGRCSPSCPLSIHTASKRFHKKQKATRGPLSYCAAC